MTWVTEPQKIRSLYGRCSLRSTTTSLRPTARRPRGCHINGFDKRPASLVAISGLILQPGHPETTVRQAGGSRTCSWTPCLANLQPLRSRSLTDHDVLLDDDVEASREVEQVLLIIQRQPRFGRAAREA